MATKDSSEEEWEVQRRLTEKVQISIRQSTHFKNVKHNTQVEMTD